MTAALKPRARGLVRRDAHAPSHAACQRMPEPDASAGLSTGLIAAETLARSQLAMVLRPRLG